MTTDNATKDLAMKQRAASSGIIENATVTTVAIDPAGTAAKHITEGRATDLIRAARAATSNERPAATIRHRADIAIRRRLVAIMTHRNGRGQRTIGHRATIMVTEVTTATMPSTGALLAVVKQQVIIGSMTATTGRMARIAARNIIAATPRIMPIMHGTTTHTDRTSTTVVRTADNRLAVTILLKDHGVTSRRYRIVRGTLGTKPALTPISTG